MKFSRRHKTSMKRREDSYNEEELFQESQSPFEVKPVCEDCNEDIVDIRARNEYYGTYYDKFYEICYAMRKPPVQ